MCELLSACVFRTGPLLLWGNELKVGNMRLLPVYSPAVAPLLLIPRYPCPPIHTGTRY